MTFKLIKKWLTNACVYYTLFSLLLMGIQLCLKESSMKTVLDNSFFLRIFPCSLAFSFAGMLNKNEKISRWGRILSHYLIEVLAMFCFLWLPFAVNNGNPASHNLMAFFLFTVLYWIGFLLVHLTLHRIRRVMEED
jgi:hypothetical protein